MHLHVTAASLVTIKDSLRKSNPSEKPSHRIEAAARALGFGSYASLRAALHLGKCPVNVNDAAYCESLGIPDLDDKGEPCRALSRAVARGMLHPVLDSQPDLTLRGFDSIWQGDRIELSKSIPDRELMLKARRTEAYHDDWSADQFELALIFLSRQRKIKTINRSYGTYSLKHRAEGLSRHFGLFTHLGNYVSNGMMIAAAYEADFPVRRIGYDSYNAHLGISKETVRNSAGFGRGATGGSKTVQQRLVTEMYDVTGKSDRRAA